MCILRDYQNTAVSSARESIVSGHKRPLIVLPTGSGKSLIYGEIINLAVSKGKTCLFLVHRRNLVRQFADTLDRHFGITAGVIMAGEEFIQGNQVYVSTVQTYHRRMHLDELQYNHFFIDADIILTDESHTSISKRYQDIYSAYQDKVIIGTTATPVRADGRGLGEIYDDLISIIDVGELTEKGYLCPVKYYAPTEIDLSKIKLEMGDYDKKAIGAKMDKPKLVGDVVQNWLKLAENRKTIVFAVNVKHSIHLRDEFIKAGIPAMHLDAKSGDDEREYAFKEMDEGRIKVICNVALYIEGMDVPDISCVVMARPTKSLGLFRQCLDSQTEILTESGWLGINDDFSDKKVFQFHTETMGVSLVHGQKMVRLLGGEEMFGIVSPHLDIRVTAGHRMFHSTRIRIDGKSVRTSLRESTAKSLPSSFYLPLCGDIKNNDAPIRDCDLSFIGLLLTDGCLNKKTNSISIYQSEKNRDVIEFINKTLDNCGFKYGHSVRTNPTNYGERSPLHCWTISKGKARGRDKHLTGWGELDGWIIGGKTLSPKMYSISSRQVSVLLTAMVAGNGAKNVPDSWLRKTDSLTVSNKKLAEDLQALLVISGYRCNISAHDNGSPAVVLHISKDHEWSVTRKSSDNRPVWGVLPSFHDERVWCVSVPSGAIITRRKGKVAVLGNCVGRGLRPSPGKENLILLDFAGVISEHGYITDPVEWFLDGDEKAWKKKEREKKDKQPMKCPTCHAIFEATTHCPDCGSEMKKFGRKVEAVDGELVEHKGKKSFSPAEKRRWFGMFEWYRRKKGYKSGWSAWSYKDKTGVWPRGMDSVSPIEPDETFFNWIKYTNIRKAKSKGTT